MAAIDDLTAAVAALSTAVTNENTEITTLVSQIQAANTAGTNDPAIEAAAQSILSSVASMNAAVTAAQTPPATT